MNDLFNQPPLPDPVITARDNAMALVEENAGQAFMQRARELAVLYLKGCEGQQAPGEQITNYCKDQGAVPHDDRAFGSVFMGLARAGVIEKAGVCLRRKGHLTSGGIVWKLRDQ